MRTACRAAEDGTDSGRVRRYLHLLDELRGPTEHIRLEYFSGPDSGAYAEAVRLYRWLFRGTGLA